MIISRRHSHCARVWWNDAIIFYFSSHAILLMPVKPFGKWKITGSMIWLRCRCSYASSCRNRIPDVSPISSYQKIMLHCSVGDISLRARCQHGADARIRCWLTFGALSESRRRAARPELRFHWRTGDALAAAEIRYYVFSSRGRRPIRPIVISASRRPMTDWLWADKIPLYTRRKRVILHELQHRAIAIFIGGAVIISTLWVQNSVMSGAPIAESTPISRCTWGACGVSKDELWSASSARRISFISRADI